MNKNNKKTDNTIIPAHPGYQWLIPRTDNKNNLIGIMHLPVLAWSISHDLCDESDLLVTPITYRGQEELEYGALQLPDGTISAPYEDIDLNCEADLLAYWMELKAEAEADACNVPNATMVN